MCPGGTQWLFVTIESFRPPGEHIAGKGTIARPLAARLGGGGSVSAGRV